MSSISYPRTETKAETKRDCEEVVFLINELLSKGYLTTKELRLLIELISKINWVIGAKSYKIKTLKKAQALVEQILTADQRLRNEELKACYKEREELKNKGNSKARVLDEKININETFISGYNNLRLQLQTAALLLSGSDDTRPIFERLNQPIVDEPSFRPYDFKSFKAFDGVTYFRDDNGNLLRQAFLEKVDIEVYEEEYHRSQASGSNDLITLDERVKLEQEVNNIASLSSETRTEIEEGWMCGRVTRLDHEFPELNNVNKCIEVLDDFGVLFGKYNELGKSGKGKNMFHINGYQKEHYPPYSLFMVRATMKNEGRSSVPLIDGLGEYSEKNALCFSIFDGQHKHEEHWFATRESEKFMNALQAKGVKATLGNWLDKSIEWNATIFTGRLERDAVMPEDLNERAQLKKQLAAQGRKAAIALRNVTKAHFIGLAGTNVLDIRLENGRYRNRSVENKSKGEENEF